MTRKEILKGIEAMQKIQSENQPSSERWQRASIVLNKLGALLNRLQAERDFVKAFTPNKYGEYA